MASNEKRLSNNKLNLHILKHPDLSTIERFVALVIACHRNEITLKCCPTHKQIGKIVSIEERWKIGRIINQLRIKKILGTIKLPNIEQPTRSPNQYYFLLDFDLAKKIANSYGFDGDVDSLDCYCIKLENKPL